MKKLLIFILIIASVFAFTACDFAGIVDKFKGDDGSSLTDGGNADGNGSDKTKHTYLDFNQTEKNLFTKYVGKVIPFIPCDEYYVEGYYEVDDYDNGMHFYTVGNTAEEFESYRNAFAAYTLEKTYQDNLGKTWYYYTDGTLIVEVSYYSYSQKNYIDVFAYYGNGNNNPDTGDGTANTKKDEWLEDYDCITIEDTYDICDAAGDTKTEERYYVIGEVVSVEDTYYGKMIIKDSTGELLVYGSYGADGVNRYGDLTVAVPKAGDVVLFYGNFKTHNGTREMYSGWIIDFYTPGSSNTGTGSTGTGNTGTGTDGTANTKKDEWLEDYDCITIEDTYDICDAAGDTKTEERYYVIGEVVSVEDTYYGKMIIKDSTGELLVYGSYGADGVNRYGDLTVAVPKAGDVVLFYGNFKTHSGTREMYSGWIIDFYTPGSSNTGTGSTGTGNTGTGTGNTGTGTDGTTNTKKDEWLEDYDCITIEDTYDICDAAGDTKTEERYYVIGEVVSVEDTYYGKMIIKDSTGEILVYGSYGADGVNRYGDLTVAVPKAGDVVLFYGNFMKYDGTREMYSGWIIDFYTPGSSNTGTGSTGTGNTGTGTGTDGTTNTKKDEWLEDYDCITIEDTYDICDAAGDTKTEERYYVIGTVVSVEDTYYGKMIIKDSTGEILVYGSYGADGVNRYGDLTVAVPKAGDVVLFYGNFMKYDGTREMYSGWIIDFYTTGTSGQGTGNTGTNTGGGNNTNSNIDVITNEGAGLPEDNDGVFDVNFKAADKVKDVTDQGYYLDGCPTTGSPAVLVIPVEFSDSLASTKGYNTSALVNAFSKNGVTDYYSVYDYYYISSYGKLTLDITVLDFWFKPEKSSSYYYNATFDYYGEDTAIGDQLILDEALAYLAGIMDLSEFDSDNNGTIDSVILINTLDIGEEDFYWAYRYWNIYTDDEEYYKYDGVYANDYVWASYQFLYECYDDNDEVFYDSTAMNTYTFIHEFAHVLGADDYYDTEYVEHPMDGHDIMDSMVGDHNAYTKINLGWITTSRLVVAGSSITLTLEDFSKNGDTIIIANNWDEKLGAYQEYYVLVYYKNTGLNADDAGYFSRDGVLVYHVNASLFREVYEGEIYYDVYNTNTDASSDYGTEDNLIEFVKSAEDTYTYIAGDTMPKVTDDLGDELGYNFVVVSLTDDVATITFNVAQ